MKLKGAKKEIANNTIQEMAIKSLVPKNELSHKATIAECSLVTPAMGLASTKPITSDDSHNTVSSYYIVTMQPLYSHNTVSSSDNVSPHSHWIYLQQSCSSSTRWYYQNVCWCHLSPRNVSVCETELVLICFLCSFIKKIPIRDFLSVLWNFAKLSIWCVIYSYSKYHLMQSRLILKIVCLWRCNDILLGYIKLQPCFLPSTDLCHTNCGLGFQAPPMQLQL